MTKPPTLDFSSLTGSGVRVAIIDTGIALNHESVGTVATGVSLRLSKEGDAFADSDYSDVYGHGTACAAIIRRIAPACELVAVRIASESEMIPPGLLSAGIDWAVDHGAAVINISLGTRSQTTREELEESSRKAAAAGVVVVAAESNDGRLTYPALCEPSIVVGSDDDERTGKYGYASDPSDPRRFTAFGGHQKVAWLQPAHIFSTGTSFAGPRLAGVIALVIERCGTLGRDELLSILDHNATSQAASVRPSAPGAVAADDSRELSWIGRAALYPYSKENQSLVRFQELLPFKVTAIADPVGKRMVGKDAGAAIGIAETGVRVESSVDSALKRADTLVLGFVGQLGRLRGRDTRREMVAKAIGLGKNVFSYEPLNMVEYEPLLAEGRRRGLRITWPSVAASDLEELQQENLAAHPYTATPILGIFGTSSAQGKFTAQLRLGMDLKRKGLRVSQIGSEHQSMLLGMDDAFPLGHVKNVTLGHYAWSEYFELRYQQLVRDEKPQIITVGSQGGIIPYKVSPGEHLKTYVNLAYLMASRADSYVVVVNHQDSFGFIQDVLDSLRSIGKGQTILIAVSSRRRRIVESFGRRLVTVEDVEPSEQRSFLARLEDHFGIPARTILGGDDTSKMAEVVIDAYSGSGRAAGRKGVDASG